MTKKKTRADYLFEASWEVCNKVGGIYTVVKSKAYAMKDYYKNYFLIGPYFFNKARVELDKKEVPEEFKNAFDLLSKEGLRFHYGSWNINGSPNVILIDFQSLVQQKNKIKEDIWKLNGIDSYNSGWEFEEPMVWSWAVGKLLFAIEKELLNKKIIGHFHEWLSGFSIFYLKNNNSKIKTVFTTHATMLGRTMSGSGENLYNILDNIDSKERAYHYGVQDKFLTEKAAANTANVFTTVSEITAIEAEKLLGRKPDVILNNGLTMKNFPTIEETSVRHLMNRDKIRDFLTFYFFPYYTMELEHNITFFILGRFEYRNKGIDILISALGKLNERLKKEKSKRTISVFFWIPASHNGLNIEVLENKNYYNHIKNYVQWHSKEVLDSIIKDIVNNKTPKLKSFFTEKFLKDIEKDMLQFQRAGNPPVSTHYINDENKNPILIGFKNAGLDNREDDKVKVILNPVYLDGNDGLINLPLYDAISGSHFGLFPSYYEPWGYTPLESAALGVASLTTDLAGFGRFIDKQIPNKRDKLRGIYVLERFNKSEDQIVDNLYKMMHDFATLSHEERVRNKVVAKNLSNTCDWKHFVENYIDAHNKAFEK